MAGRAFHETTQKMSESRILVRLLRMYFPRNWELDSALSKLRNFRGGSWTKLPPSVRHWPDLAVKTSYNSALYKVSVQWKLWCHISVILTTWNLQVHIHHISYTVWPWKDLWAFWNIGNSLPRTLHNNPEDLYRCTLHYGFT